MDMQEVGWLCAGPLGYATSAYWRLRRREVQNGNQYGYYACPQQQVSNTVNHLLLLLPIGSRLQKRHRASSKGS
jgi:hypothetical protein